jgi:hypothetical protein
MARYLTAQDEHVRMRWKAYLSGFIPAPVSVPKLDAQLRDAEGSKSNARRDALGQYLIGKRTVTQERAFEIGEGLRALGCEHTNGIMAMYAAGHYATCIALIGRLGERGRDVVPHEKFVAGRARSIGLPRQTGISLAIDLHAFLPLAVHFEVDARLENLSPEQDLDHKELLGPDKPVPAILRPAILRPTFDQARKICVAAGNSIDLHDAWHLLNRESNPLRGVHSRDVHFAYEIALSSKMIPVRARDLAWQALNFWIDDLEQTENFPAKGAHEKRARARDAYAKWRASRTFERRNQEQQTAASAPYLDDHEHREDGDAPFASLEQEGAEVERAAIERERKRDARNLRNPKYSRSNERQKEK